MRFGRAPERAGKRNRQRFPADFMFQLTAKQDRILRSQNAISRKHGGRRYLPYAFTEHGAIMAATVLEIIDAIKELMSPEKTPRGKIGSSLRRSTR
jgi:hypothetical protein